MSLERHHRTVTPLEKEKDSQGPQVEEGTARDRDIWRGSQEKSLEETTLVEEIGDSESQEVEFQESEPEDSIFLKRKMRKETSEDLTKESKYKIPRKFFLHEKICISQETYKDKKGE